MYVFTVKFSIFRDDIIRYINHRESIYQKKKKILLEQTHEFRKVTEENINKQIYIVFLYTSNEQLEMKL